MTTVTIINDIETAIIEDVADKSDNTTPKAPDVNATTTLRMAKYNLSRSTDPVDQAVYHDFTSIINDCYQAVWDDLPGVAADQQSAAKKEKLDQILSGAGSASSPIVASSLTLAPDDASWLKMVILNYFTYGQEYYTGRLATFKADIASRGISTTDFDALAAQCLTAAQNAAPNDAARSAAVDRELGLTAISTAAPAITTAPTIRIGTEKLTAESDDASWLKMITLTYGPYTVQTATEEQIRAEVNAKIRDAEIRLETAYRTYSANQNEENRQNYLEASADVDLYKSQPYYNTFYQENYSRIFHEELRRMATKMLNSAKIAQDRSTDGDMDHGAFSVGLDNWQGASTFKQVIRVNYHRAVGGYPNVKTGYYLQAWFAPSGSDSLAIPLYNIPAGGTIGAFLRLGGVIPDTRPEVYPSIEFGAGFDPIRTVGGLIIGTVDAPVVGTIIGGFNGLISGLEVHVDGGVNIGPVGLRGGFYPCGEITLPGGFMPDYETGLPAPTVTALQGLNPGVRLEGTF